MQASASPGPAVRLEFGFGTGVQALTLPKENLLGVLMANQIVHPLRGEAAVRAALQSPIGAGPLSTAVRPGKKIAIVVSDISRPVPSAVLLPPVLEELQKAGCRREDITIVFALGSHRRHTPQEQRQLVGEEVFRNYRCVDSDPDDCVRLGFTENGTPVDVTRSVAEADFRICTGNIEFHYFAGFSGGAKAIMPGVSSREAIQKNHSLMVCDAACAGRLSGNPLREDIEQAGRICGVDYIVNVVLDEHRQIVHAVAGDSVEAHRAGCRYLDRVYRVRIPKRADIVLVSQGGAPKDANLYQVQKALDNAKHAVRPGGTVILIGACPEGLGSKTFERWLLEAPDAPSLIARVREHFELGGHKAAAIAMVLQSARIDLVSELPEALVRRIFLHPQPSAQQALDEALARYGPGASVLAMPFGGATLPSAEAEITE